MFWAVSGRGTARKPPKKGGEIMPDWTVYILKCRDDTLYTGITDNFPRRLAAHNRGTGAKYTRGRGPVTPVYRETCPDKSTALKREIAIKKLSRREKLELCRKYTDSGNEPLQNAQSCQLSE